MALDFVYTIRDAAARNVPRWMTGFWASRLLYAMAVHLDAAVDAANAAVLFRFPGRYADDTLPMIGRERGIMRGALETAASYADRLTRWRSERRVKGNPYAIMRQLRGQLSPMTPRIQVYNNNGVRYEMLEDGTVILPRQTPWNWDGDYSKPTRRWIVIYVTDGSWVSDGTWASAGVWGDGGVIGSSATWAEVQNIGRIAASWTAAHCHTDAVIVVLDTPAWDAQQPAGNWDRYANRNATALYMQGS